MRTGCLRINHIQVIKARRLQAEEGRHLMSCSGRAGYTDTARCRSQRRRWNAAKLNALAIRLEWDHNTCLSSWCLWMKVPVTAELLYEIKRGHLRADELVESTSLQEESGKSVI